MPTISKNIFWSTLTSILQLYTGSIVFIVLAKLMAIYEFGILSFGFSLSSMVVVVADFGFSLMIIKEYPEQGANARKYIQNGIFAKSVLSALCGAFFLLYLVSFYKGLSLQVGVIYILFAIIASYILYLQSLLKIQNRFRSFTATNIIYAIAISLTVLFYWLVDISLLVLVTLFLFAKVVQLLWTMYQCRHSLGLSLRLSSGTIRLIGKSWSFGIFNVLGIFYFMVDTQLISVFLGAKEVALYQAVFRIMLILMVFSDVLSNVLLPYLSFKFYRKEDLGLLINKLFFYLLIIGSSLFLLFTSFKTSLIEFLYTPEYMEAVVLILPFGIVVVIRTLSTLLGNLLTISNKQVYRVVGVSISLIMSLLLNILLIPKFGIIASAWISVVVHLILFAIYLFYSKMEVENFKVLDMSNILVFAITAVIYLCLNVWGSSKLWLVMVLGLTWFLVIAALLRTNGNWSYLRGMLREKGVG